MLNLTIGATIYMSTNLLVEYNEQLLTNRLASNDDKDKTVAARSPRLKEHQQLQLVSEGKAAVLSSLLLNSKTTATTLHAIVQKMIDDRERFNHTFVKQTIYSIAVKNETSYETVLLIAESKELAKDISVSNDFLYWRLATTYRKELNATVSQRLNSDVTGLPIGYIFKILDLNVTTVT